MSAKKIIEEVVKEERLVLTHWPGCGLYSGHPSVFSVCTCSGGHDEVVMYRCPYCLVKRAHTKTQIKQHISIKHKLP